MKSKLFIVTGLLALGFTGISCTTEGAGALGGLGEAIIGNQSGEEEDGSLIEAATGALTGKEKDKKEEAEHGHH